MFYETYILVLQLVMMTSDSVNRFVEMLLFFQYFNIFSIKCLVIFFKSLKAEKVPESKLIKNKLELNLKTFLPEN